MVREFRSLHTTRTVNQKYKLNEREWINMNFEQALDNLRTGEILTRSTWVGKMIKMENKQFVIWGNNSFDRPIYNCTSEDILAEDWEVIDPNNIKEFSLSVNELKNLGVSQEAIDKLKSEKVNILGVSSKLVDLIDPEKIKELLNTPMQSSYTVPDNKLPQINRK